MAVIGQRIKKLREKRNWLQKDVGEKIGVSSATINRYEKGLRQPDPDTINRLCDIFNTTTDYLLGRTDNPNPAKNKKPRKGGTIITHKGIEIELTEEEEEVVASIVQALRERKEREKEEAATITLEKSIIERKRA
jgi:transcriptional regulator with XRE-family HTH domain